MNHGARALGAIMGPGYSGWTFSCSPHFDDGYRCAVTAPDGRTESFLLTARQLAINPEPGWGVNYVAKEARKLVRKLEQDDPRVPQRCSAAGPLELVRCW